MFKPLLNTFKTNKTERNKPRSKKMKNANNAKKVLNETLSTHLEDEGLTVKRGTIEEVVTSHMAGELTHEFCVKVYGCKPGRAQRIITTLNKLVPRKTNKGASKMTAKKTASAKPATKKPATKKGPEKKKVAKAPKIAKTGVTQPREGTVTRAVWDGLDKLKKTLKRAPTR